LGHKLGGNELGDGLREVDAVDENINVDNLLERSTLGSLCHIPLDDIVPGVCISVTQPIPVGSHSLLQAGLPEKVDSSTATPSQSTNDQYPDILDTASDALKSRLDVVNHLGLVGIWLQTLQNTLSTFLLLLGKRKSSGGGTCESSVEAECCDSSLGGGVLEEFKVVQRALSLGESTENVGPTALLLVAVGELDVGMRKGVAAVSAMILLSPGYCSPRRLWQLLETNDGRVDGSRRPLVVRYERAPSTDRQLRRRSAISQSSLFEFLIIKDPLGITLNHNIKVVVEQYLCGRRSQSGPMLKWLLLTSQPNGLTRMSLG
jgi:hypothetical protein